MLTRADISQACPTLRPWIRTTPVVQVRAEDFGLPPFPLTLKLELLQHAGSFKTRGAFANLLLREVPAAGVAAASGGNHGAAVAYAALRREVKATVFVPEVSNPAKVQRIRSYGADLVVTGSGYSEALEACQRWVAESGALSIHAFDQRETLLGTGTVGMEIAQQGDFDTLLVAVGGGGLIAGIAAWFEGRVRVIGVEPEASPTLTRALEAGRPVDAPVGGLAADSLAPRRVGDLVFPIAQKHVDRVLLVSEEAIQRARETLWDRLRVLAEPGAAVPLAALLERIYEPAPGERVAVLVSGGNTDAVRLG